MVCSKERNIKLNELQRSKQLFSKKELNKNQTSDEQCGARGYDVKTCCAITT